jgi:hypothetical protein
MRFCACVREISKQSQVSPKARHTRHLLLLKKSCRKELLRFYARRNARHCSHARAATTSCPGTSALQPPLRCCVSMPGKTPGAAAMCALPPRHAWGHWCCSCRCAAASRLLAKPRRCSHVCAAATSRPGTLALQPPLRLEAPAAVRAPPPRHTRGHWRCSRRCAAAS